MIHALLLSFCLAAPLAGPGAHSTEAPQGAPPAVAKPSTPAISYRLKLDLEAECLHFEAEVSGLDQEEERLELRMVEAYAFANLEAPLLLGPIQAFNREREVLVLEEHTPFDWSVRTGGASWVRLVWSVGLSHRELIDGRRSDAYEHPYLAEEHGMLSMPASFVLVPRVAAEATRIRVELPEGWELRTPWEELGEGWYRPARMRSLESDYFAVGDWDEHGLEVDGAQVSVLFAPGQERLAKAVLPILVPVLEAELELFDHQPFERYLVFFGRPEDPGMGGSPKELSMTLFVASKQPQGAIVDQVAHVIAHEFHHTWMVSRYQMKDELRFINEGFTDFFAYLVPSRLGLVAPGFFAEALCTALSTWEGTPLLKTHSLVEAGGPIFFEGSHANRLVYRGGMVVAALLDVSLMNAERPTDLAEFLRQFNNDERWSPQGAAPGLEDFEALLAFHLGEQRAAELLRIVTSRELPDLVPLFEEQGVELLRSESPARMGLRANLDETTLVDLDPTGMASRVGLRVGDTILSVGGQSVIDAGELRAAWSRQRGRVQVSFLRDGEEQSLDTELPKVVVYRLGDNPWSF